jgi:uncharacterized cupredoxin-like copper-binding protein
LEDVFEKYPGRVKNQKIPPPAGEIQIIREWRTDRSTLFQRNNNRRKKGDSMRHLFPSAKITAALFLSMILLGPIAAHSAEKISIKAGDFHFEPKEIRVKSGEPVSISVENIGAAKHNITILDTQGKKMVGKDVPTKTTVTLEVTFPKPGAYGFYCDIGGHRKAGMEGRFEVAP